MQTVWFYAFNSSGSAALAPRERIDIRNANGHANSNAGSSEDARWLYPPSGFASHSRVEVFHCIEDVAASTVTTRLPITYLFAYCVKSHEHSSRLRFLAIWPPHALQSGIYSR